MLADPPPPVLDTLEAETTGPARRALEEAHFSVGQAITALRRAGVTQGHVVQNADVATAVALAVEAAQREGGQAAAALGRELPWLAELAELRAPRRGGLHWVPLVSFATSFSKLSRLFAVRQAIGRDLAALGAEASDDVPDPNVLERLLGRGRALGWVLLLALSGLAVLAIVALAGVLR